MNAVPSVGAGSSSNDKDGASVHQESVKETSTAYNPCRAMRTFGEIIVLNHLHHYSQRQPLARAEGRS
jgi:hypothetical protein